MESWSAPGPPALPGRGPPRPGLRHRQPGRSGPPRPARRPACTSAASRPYDATHLGHAATYVAFDLLHRAWLDAGHDVTTCRTSPTSTTRCWSGPSRPGRTGGSWPRRETELFREDMAALRVLPPAHYIGAVESIPSSSDHGRRRCWTEGAAYDVDGDIYFSVHADPRFGDVAGSDREQMLAVFAERGGDPDRPGKKDPLDCLLWQAERPGEPAWDSAARPRAARLAHRVHRDRAGAPRHDRSTCRAAAATWSSRTTRWAPREAAGAHRASGRSPGPTCTPAWSASTARRCRSPAATWSSSRGCAATGVDPMAIRLALLAHHYRDDWEWTDADLLRRRAAPRPLAGGGRPRRPDRRPATLLGRVRQRLADDLDAPAALAAVDRWAEESRLRGGDDSAAPAWSATWPPPCSASRCSSSASRARLGPGDAAQVALELPRDRVAAGLRQLGGVAGLLERADVLGDLVVLLGQLVDAALPGARLLLAGRRAAPGCRARPRPGAAARGSPWGTAAAAT